MSKWITLFALSIVWGSSFFFIKKALIAFAPEQVAVLRIGFAGLVMLPIVFRAIPHIPKKYYLPILGVGIFGNGAPAFLYPIAQQHVDSSVAGILNSLTPLMAFIIGILGFGVVFRWNKLIGVLLGLAGAISLVLTQGVEGMSDSARGYSAIILLATVFYGTSVNIVDKYLKSTKALHITAFSLVIIAIPAWIAWFILGIPDQLMSHPQGWLSLGAAAALGISSTALATIFFYQLVQKTDAIWASQVAYLIPVVALVIGLWDGESIGWPHMIGMGLILAGVFISRTTSGATRVASD